MTDTEDPFSERASLFLLRRIYAEHADAVYSYVRRTCGPRLAADITQDVFTALWHQQRIDVDSATMRARLMHMARQRVTNVIDAGRGPDVGEQPRTSADEPSAQLSERVQAAIASLRPGVREIILMAVDGQMTYAQIAREVGLPEATVTSRMRAGLHQLRRALNDEL